MLFGMMKVLKKSPATKNGGVKNIFIDYQRITALDLTAMPLRG
jgi:hypothetical protein